MQGWSPDFIPKLTADAVDTGVIQKILRIPGTEAMRCSRELAQKERIFLGITSGATLRRFGRAVLVNATGSPARIAYAAAHSDLVFITSPTGHEIDAALAALPAHNALIKAAGAERGRELRTVGEVSRTALPQIYPDTPRPDHIRSLQKLEKVG